MRIAYFSETFLPQVDGIAFTLAHLFNFLEKKGGYETIMFAPKGTLDSYASTKIIHQSSVKMAFYAERRVASPLARVEKKVLAFKPDLIHLVAPTSLGVAGLRVARKHSIPVVASYHTDLSGFARHWKMGALSEPIFSWYRRIHNRSDINLVPSEFTLRQLKAKGFKRLAVWPGGVDLDRFHPAKRSGKWRKRLTEGHSDETLLLFVSRLSREKRADLLLPLIKETPGLRLAIIGGGPDQKRLEKVFEGTPTYFAGFLHGEDLAQAYASGDIFVFTGAEETFGNVVVEAMASGLPVVAPGSGGVVDLVKPGENGYLYPPEDSARLSRAVKKLIKEPAMAKKFGKAGRERAQKYSWDNTFNLLLDIYDQVLIKQPNAKLRSASR